MESEYQNFPTQRVLFNEYNRENVSEIKSIRISINKLIRKELIDRETSAIKHIYWITHIGITVYESSK